MGTLKRYTFPLAAGFVLIPLMMAGARTKVAVVTFSSHDLPVVNVQGLENHALELTAGRTVASDDTEQNQDLRKDILAAVKRSLPKEYRGSAFEIARTVITEANHHLMDPFFLLAVIKTESHFNIKARGRHGEIGLMQILPVTAKWLAPQAGLLPDEVNLEDPKTNIRIGATYLASLRKSFSGYGARYIGAYNMGSRNVRRLMAMNMDPEVYPGKVLKNYRGFYKVLNSVEASAKPAPLKKLQTRVVAPKCRATKCPSIKRTPIMPNWMSS